MADMEKIARRVDALMRQYAERDQRHQLVHDARSQKIDQIAPGTMPDAWPRPITANMIDMAARQLAENLAPLPSINCASGTGNSERQKKYVAKKTKIAYSYIIDSFLETKMPTGCDWYLTYGAMPIIVEPDFEKGAPRLRIDNPMKTYPQFDLAGNVISYTKVWQEEAWKLAAKFPQHAAAILGKTGDPWNRANSGDSQLKVVKYCDKDQYVLYMPERSNLVLSEMENTFGKVPIRIALKPSWDEQDRGQFDDAIWPSLARNRIAMLGLQATNQTVRAPLALPSDVQKISFGDDAIIRTDNPDKIRRVGTDIPTAAWQQDALLSEEVMRATRTPRAASGDVDASIITGKGVEALNGGYDIQIRTGQLMIGHALSGALELAFEMDEKFWPDARKDISGVINGTPFQETYTPSKDIKGNHRVSVSYGFASGMNPNQALVFLLQLRGDQLVPRDFVQRQLPMDVDVAELQQRVDIEQAEDALKQGLFQTAASFGLLAQQGMDPTAILRQLAAVIRAREKGTPMHEAILQAFAPEPPPEQAAPAGPEALLGGAPAPAGPPSAGAPQQGVGGAMDLQTLLAGLSSSGQPRLSASVQRRTPV
jgi:hypothetical protein